MSKNKKNRIVELSQIAPIANEIVEVNAVEMEETFEEIAARMEAEDDTIREAYEADENLTMDELTEEEIALMDGLQNAAEEFNVAFGLNPVIETSSPLEKLHKEILEVSRFLIPSKDEKLFTPETMTFLRSINATFAPETKVAFKRTIKPTVAPKEKGITRAAAIAFALKAKPATFNEWAEKADALFVEGGGKTNLQQAKNDMAYVCKFLAEYGIDFPKPVAASKK